MSKKLVQKSSVGLTLIELMIAVVIVGVLASVAIPTYLDYVRRSYLNEANQSISTIKSAEESYFNLHGCYISASAHPATPPRGTSTAWGTTPPSEWGNSGLAVRPDRLVRFSYSVYASNSLGTGASPAACAAPSSTYGVRSLAGVCVNTSDVLVPNAIFGTHWFFIVARGDLDGDGIASNILSAIDDSRVIMCNELE